MAPLAIGLMSGTSGDGVSTALVRFDGRRIRLLGEHTVPYPPRLSRSLEATERLSVPALSALNVEVGERFAHAVHTLLRAANVSPKRIAVIGSHGHTIYHGPTDATPSTWQCGEPAVIAQRTGIPVVADFRPRDIAAGGAGAPLVPFFDKYFFGHGRPRALQNLGGIANVTFVGKTAPTIAFDTGPGNRLIDLVVQQMSGGRLRYDVDGRLARRGWIDMRAVTRLARLPYFKRRPPKSTGKELFHLDLLRRCFGRELQQHPVDVLATVTYFTAYSIAESYRRFLPRQPEEVIASGGGVHNQTLMRHLAHLLDPIPVRSIDAFGLSAQAKEPAAFAFLAWCTLRGRPNHLPTTTGADAPHILGALTR